MRKRKVQTIVIEGSKATCLHTEDGVDLRELGVITRAKKISDIRFNVETQLWEAVDRKTKRVIARDPSRKGCVQKEHDYYEGMIAKGRMPWDR